MSYIIQKQNIIVFSRRPGGWETTLQVLMILLSNLIAFLKWIMIMLAIFSDDGYCSLWLLVLQLLVLYGDYSNGKW